MALYRKLQTTFWTDTKVVDDFTPEDRYFYIYLLTNPHTNLCGCYEISVKQMADETGYSKETVQKLIDRMSNLHKTAFYDPDTREVLVLNWHKYNWTSSPKFRKPVGKEIECIKNADYKRYLTASFNNSDTVSIPYPYPMDTTVTNTNTVSNTVSDTDTNTPADDKKKDKTPYQEVLNLYHSICTSLPTVRTYTEKRKKGVKARLGTYSLEDIKEAFSKAAASRFMNGDNDRKWKADFEWFFVYGDNNIAKVLEGKYDNDRFFWKDKDKIDSSTGYDPEIWERLANERREDFD